MMPSHERQSYGAASAEVTVASPGPLPLLLFLFIIFLLLLLFAIPTCVGTSRAVVGETPVVEATDTPAGTESDAAAVVKLVGASV